MKDMKKILEERAQYLRRVKTKKEQELLNAPEGSLRVCNRGGRPQYYQRNNPKDLDYPQVNPEQVYENLHLARQKLVCPICETDEQYVQKWEAVKYQGKTFHENMPEYYTEKGERVRSKSEIIIADFLNKQGIPYRYEYPVYLSGWGNVYPDFTLLNVRERKEIYWEHFGRMSDADYAEKTIQKIALYEQNNIFIGDKLILTFETQNHPLNQKQILNIVNHYFL